ncbi:DUF998 domain-containing protein [Paenibacillus pasadenensis]|uniref:DUF998 domain-containing protein n=1 Tax=Paenibacillus pasadenensis TaxID=217090 RepID=UPI002040067E|nr:DUF998 domain-containing protein [Paenibacillus pasadenensis]MCM3746425.1 DUF998 domain-containing protein [Paenibacillus pasadenensis]
MQQTMMKTDRADVNRMLLIGGAISAPLFFVVSIVQVMMRSGFDIRRHAISMLSLGDAGWIQSANFMLTGCLGIVAAIGISRQLRGDRMGVWGAILIGLYGVGMIVAGIYPPDAGLSFPPGASVEMPARMSSTALIHSAAFFTSFICLVAACLMYARSFAVRRNRAWMSYCIATGTLSPALIAAGASMSNGIGVVMAIAGMLAFGWVSALSLRLMPKLSN